MPISNSGDSQRIEAALDDIEAAGGTILDAGLPDKVEKEILGYLNSAHEILDGILEASGSETAEQSGAEQGNMQVTSDFAIGFDWGKYTVGLDVYQSWRAHQAGKNPQDGTAEQRGAEQGNTNATPPAPAPRNKGEAEA